MRTNKRIPAYRDGYVSFVRPLDTKVSTFGAPINTRFESDTEKVVVLAYDRMSSRQQDLDFAHLEDKKLDLKIRCPYQPAVNTKQQAIVEDILYDVYKVDADPNKMQMFIYLQENRKLWHTAIDYHPETSQEIIAGELGDLIIDNETFGSAFGYTPGEYAFCIKDGAWKYVPGKNIVGYQTVGEMVLADVIDIDPDAYGMASEAVFGAVVITLTTNPETVIIKGEI